MSAKFGECGESFYVMDERGEQMRVLNPSRYHGGEVCVEMRTSDSEIWLNSAQLRALSKRLSEMANDLDKMEGGR